MKLTSIRIKHFKAVQDSGLIKLGSLTAFVGYNGTGKSSVLEACEFLQTYALHGMDGALSPWFKFDHVLWQGVQRKRQAASPFFSQPMEIEVRGRVKEGAWRSELEIGELAEDAGGYSARSFVPMREWVKTPSMEVEYAFDPHANRQPRTQVRLYDRKASVDFQKWLFLNLNPLEIGLPRRRSESKSSSLLFKSGANLADILHSFLAEDPEGFEGLTESLIHILPYVANLSPGITNDLVETRSLIQLTERFQGGHASPLPGWVLSGGTLRLLALLAALRYPNGPSVLFVEELENGLDPRAIGFVMDEIRSAVQSGDKQVILTTHSPYLLDKLALEHVVTVERPDGGPPIFRRPADDEELQKWSSQFAPGALYSMGLLRSKKGRVR